ncbi:MAG: sugar ABC transporter permease [Clostridia bacterium]|nr:sugar ABC transporter permease [Clostridia bacterium]MCR5694620.1 sugar ABC transporter permease [Clostridia bacterium]
MKKQEKLKKKLAHSQRYTLLSFEKRRALEGFVFSIPWLIGFIGFIVIPLVLSVRISFFQTVLTDLYGFQGTSTFVGINNYVKVIQDPSVGETVFKSFGLSLIKVPVIVAFSLFVAVLLKQKFPGRTVFRVIFFIPVILAGTIMTYLFRDGVGNMSVFSTITTGVTEINSFFGTIMSNIGSIMWASSVEILIFLAALQSVPATLYEVVEIDGASAWESFWHVTLPYISPFVILNCIYALVDSFVASDNPVMSIMNSMTQEGTKYGQASALSWLYMLATLAVILIFILFTRRWLK